MTTHQARPYQAVMIDQTDNAWVAGHRNVLDVLSTGGGKTKVAADHIAAEKGAVCAMAHRQELVTQISTALAREGVRHRIIGQRSVAQACSAEHMERLGRDYVSPNSRVAVASVDTLLRLTGYNEWMDQVQLWFCDEAHHLQVGNKWGKATQFFRNARGLGVTATPCRADGGGLGADNDGVFHTMVQGPGMRELIEMGFLCDYRIVARPSDMRISEDWVTATGDYSRDKLSKARAESHVTGDIVQHYMQFASGRLGITFDVDVASATDTAAAFRAAGVPAEVVSAKTPDDVRRAILRRFRRRELLQLVNVDLFGEGFDLPAIEVVSMGRPTQSYSLFAQGFGRALRPDPENPGKRALVIDHVGNVARHGLPDAYREWSLDRRERRSKGGASDVVPTRTCTEPLCSSVFERYLKACPFCGAEVVIADRSHPSYVDGVLEELDPSVLARMRGDAEKVFRPALMPVNVSWEARGAILKHHDRAKTAQEALRPVMDLWAGWQAHQGRGQREAEARFYHRYGLDVMSAQALKAREAEELRARIETDLTKHGVVRQ